MPRLFVHVEGHTEEAFVNEVLRAHLCARGYHSVEARLIGNARQRSRRGGARGWESVRTDIVRHLKEDADRIATTLVDYYGMPVSPSRQWPGRLEASAKHLSERSKTVENAMLADVVSHLDPRFDRRRFVPYVVTHEFEGLLFSDCKRFAAGIGRPELEASFQQIRDQFGTPEEINDSSETAPSKRIQRLMPDYDKPLHGNLAVLEIGLDRIRLAYPLFAQWLARLEAAAAG